MNTAAPDASLARERPLPTVSPGGKGSDALVHGPAAPALLVQMAGGPSLSLPLIVLPFSSMPKSRSALGRPTVPTPGSQRLPTELFEFANSPTTCPAMLIPRPNTGIATASVTTNASLPIPCFVDDAVTTTS